MENNYNEEKVFEFIKKDLNWNKFLYDFTLSKIKTYKSSKYDNEAFGSWYIEFKNNRLIYDGKDFWLILQNKNGNDWIDKLTIPKEDIDYSEYMKLISQFQ